MTHRTRRVVSGALMAVATAVIATVAVASALLMTRYSAYEIRPLAGHPAVTVGSHVLVDRDAPVRDGDVVVHRAGGAGQQVARAGTVAAGDVVGRVVRDGTLTSVVGYVAQRAAVVGLPVGLVIGLLVGVGLPGRRRSAQAEPEEEPLLVAATDVVPQQREGELDDDMGDDVDGELADEGLELLRG